MHPELKAQTEVAVKNKNNRSFIDPANFYESERNSGYKNTGTALFEIIDNAYEANAQKIFVVADNHPGTNKPKAIAVIDNGTGMPKDFLHHACKIGGTHRASANKPLRRKGYGRFGHGLPKSSISQTRSFTVYTKNQEDTKWRALTVDIDELIKKDTTELPLEKEIDKLPAYIQRCRDKHFKNDKTGSIISWNNLDRMTWKTDNALKDNLKWRISMAYWRNIKSGLAINLLGEKILPIDPLFIDESCEYVESCQDNDLKAIKLESWDWEFKVKSEGKEQKVSAQVRASRFPPNFGSLDKTKKADRGNRTIRQKIMAEHNGILFYREGRLIDCMRHIPADAKKGYRFQTYDQNYKIEVNFPASLDEAFGISTNKQYLNCSYTTLNSDGWVKLMTECRTLYNAVEADSKKHGEKPLSEGTAALQAIDESDKVLERRGNDPIEEQKQERIKELSEKNLNKVIDLEVERRKKDLKQENIDREKVKAEITPQYSSSKREFKFEDKDEHSPFFRVHPVGGVREYYINRGHNFYKKIWTNPNCTDFMKETLKLIMSSIGEASLGASDDARRWYFEEMSQWSRHLHMTSDLFVEKNNLDDKGQIDPELDDKIPS